MKLLSIFRTYGLLHTPSTGLKMSLDRDDVQPQPTLKAPAHVKKAKPRNRRPRRIPQYKEAVEVDESANMPPT